MPKGSGPNNAVVAKTIYVILQSLTEKDVMAVMMLPSAKGIWDKLAEDYAFKSVAMAATARARFYGFRIKDGDSVVQTQHSFDAAVNECDIQGVVLCEAEKTLVLLTHPLGNWRVFMHGYANLDP